MPGPRAIGARGLAAALCGALALALGGCAGTARPEGPAPVAEAAAPARVEVTRAGSVWSADYTFAVDSPVWVLGRSSVTENGRRPWRRGSWAVTTLGVELVRIGHYDALVARGGGPVPRHVHVRFVPSSEVLVADYTPALVFSDGHVALFADHFRVLPAASRAAVAALPIDLGEGDAAGRTAIRFRDTHGTVFYRGRRLESVAPADQETYVLFGIGDPLQTPAMTQLIDPQLPAWLAASLRRDIPLLIGRHAAMLGPAPGGPPLVMVSWAGPTPGRTSMNGGVVSDTILMRFEGAGVTNENPALAAMARWFVAHEAAHFWLGQAIHYQVSRDAWITEGGADLLAVRAVEAIDPAYDGRARLNEALRQCAGFLRDRGLASAEDRGENQAYYACGAVFALAAEARSHRPFHAFVRDLVAAHRAGGVVTRADWLAALNDAALADRIAILLDRGAQDPAAALIDLLAAAGVAVAAGSDGVPVLA